MAGPRGLHASLGEELKAVARELVEGREKPWGVGWLVGWLVTLFFLGVFLRVFFGKSWNKEKW